MCMKERINVLSTEMDCITAKEAMLKAIAFLERESVVLSKFYYERIDARAG